MPKQRQQTIKVIVRGTRILPENRNGSETKHVRGKKKRKLKWKQLTANTLEGGYQVAVHLRTKEEME